MSSSLEKHHIGKDTVQILPSPKPGKIFHPLPVQRVKKCFHLHVEFKIVASSSVYRLSQIKPLVELLWWDRKFPKVVQILSQFSVATMVTYFDSCMI